MSAPPSRLRRPGLLAVLLGVLARVLWFALGVPMRWSLGRDARRAARWGAPEEEATERRGSPSRGSGSPSAPDDAFAALVLASRAPGSAAPSARDALAALAAALRRAGASSVPHVGRGARLDAHLESVAARVGTWLADGGAPAPLRDAAKIAAAAHALYGSELFPVAHASLADRDAVRALIGDAPERLAFLYATMSQKKYYRDVLAALADGGGKNHSAPMKGSSAASIASIASISLTNCYTRERVALTPSESVCLAMMHAADVYDAVPTADAVSRALAFATALRASAVRRCASLREAFGETNDASSKAARYDVNDHSPSLMAADDEAVLGKISTRGRARYEGKGWRDERDRAVEALGERRPSEGTLAWIIGTGRG